MRLRGNSPLVIPLLQGESCLLRLLSADTNPVRLLSGDSFRRSSPAPPTNRSGAAAPRGPCPLPRCLLGSPRTTATSRPPFAKMVEKQLHTLGKRKVTARSDADFVSVNYVPADAAAGLLADRERSALAAAGAETVSSHKTRRRCRLKGGCSRGKPPWAFFASFLT